MKYSLIIYSRDRLKLKVNYFYSFNDISNVNDINKLYAESIAD